MGGASLARHGRLTLHLALCLATAVFAAHGAEEAEARFDVRYRSAETIYLEGGSGQGLAVGHRLEIERDGEIIAEIEVIYVAEHSASCKILSEQQPIQAGDVAVGRGIVVPATPPPAATSPTDAGAGQAAAFSASGSAAMASAPASRRKTRISGSFSLDWEQFTDNSGRGLDYDRSVARLFFFVRNIGGQPNEIVVRGTAIRWDRASSLGSIVPETDERNRLYEASFTYNPPQGRFFYSVGRLGSAPFVSLGYLDGALGHVYVGGGFDVGAFLGKGVEFHDVDIAELGTKYGVYTRYRSNRTAPRGFEMYLAGLRENGEDEVSREYASLDFRYRGLGSWTFAQHTEIDFNRGWREDLSESSTQLSNLNLVAAGNLSPATRLIITYDRNQRYRTVETRLVPEALFDDLFRQGLRARLQIGRAGKLQFSVDAGLRDRQESEDNTISAGLNLYHPNVGVQGLLIGGSINLFDNPLTDAFMATARVAKTFRGGHEIRLVLGALRQEYDAFGRDLDTQWVRLGGWIELPARLFARIDLEYNTGDDLDGRRVGVGAGYRF